MLPSASVLVRTWFGDDSAWESLVLEVRTPSDEDFLAVVAVVNDPVFEGMSAEALREQQPGGAIPSRDGDRTEHRPFRVAPFALWSVENNINLGNSDWEDFTRSVEEDGVFRGY